MASNTSNVSKTWNQRLHTEVLSAVEDFIDGFRNNADVLINYEVKKMTTQKTTCVELSVHVNDCEHYLCKINWFIRSLNEYEMMYTTLRSFDDTWRKIKQRHSDFSSDED